MRPVGSAPSLFTLNGFGLGMYGKRDFDAETGTYIKTRCFCALFIPLFPLDAYRVADAPGRGWYFLGKERASGFVRGWRWCMLALAAGVIGSGAWNSHVKSPEYRAQRAREKATALIAEGKPLQAADVYRGIMQAGVGDPREWLEATSGLLRSEISSGDAKHVAAAVRYADEKKVVAGSRGSLLPDLSSLAMAAAEKCGNPADAESILSSFHPAPADLVKVHEALRKSLESLHAARPDDGEVNIKLALIREEFGEVEGAIGLLEPVADKLGDGEGARLYGKLLLGEGRVADALPYLESYVTPRLKDWKRVEGSLEQSFQAAQRKALDQLNGSGGPPGFKRLYEAADEAEKGRMVDEYISGQLKKDLTFLAAQERYAAAAKIVPSIMDLGVARLRVAQAQSDAAKRKGLLKEAEDAFLSLKSVAGESDEYRLFLGQIYFWSGRESEGRELFDALLASKKRDVQTLFSMADIFRDLGEDNDARKLLEEAYPKATKEAEKNSIASLRALLARDSDEKISWLAKADASDPSIAINLAEAQGEKAESTGDIEKAKRFYRQALAGYEKEQRSSAGLNNSALLYRALYRLEGAQADFETSARLLSEAVELQPANSILSKNAYESLLAAAAMRVAGDRLHPKLLQYDSGMDSLRFLYEKESEKEQLLMALKSDPNYRKSVAHFWDALLLAPKDPDMYSRGAELFAYTGDAESLQRLVEKAAEQDFDFTSQKENLARYLNKELDGDMRDSAKRLRERAKELVDGLDEPRARAMAQSYMAASEAVDFTVGDPSHAEEKIKDLKAALKVAPCSRLQSALEGVLQIVAIEKLAKDDKECAAIIEADRRLVDSHNLLLLLVRAHGELGERVRKHPAVIEARETISSTAMLFPSTFTPDDCLLLDGLHPEADPKLKELARANRLYDLNTRLRAEIKLEGPSIWMDQLWSKTLAGNEQDVRELVPKLEAAGVKVPPLF